MERIIFFKGTFTLWFYHSNLLIFISFLSHTVQQFLHLVIFFIFEMKRFVTFA